MWPRHTINISIMTSNRCIIFAKLYEKKEKCKHACSHVHTLFEPRHSLKTDGRFLLKVLQNATLSKLDVLEIILSVSVLVCFLIEQLLNVNGHNCYPSQKLRNTSHKHEMLHQIASHKANFLPNSKL